MTAYRGDPGGSGMPDPDRTRRLVGCGCYTVLMAIGGVLLVGFFSLSVFGAGFEGGQAGALRMVVSLFAAAVVALPAALAYLTFPRFLDRYDPEPVYALALALLWGGIAACGYSAVVNTVVGTVVSEAVSPSAGAAVGAVVSAPVVEEATKGAFLVGFVVFLRREFDGIVDGIIYGIFVGIGFAAVENVLYYGRSAHGEGGQGLYTTYLLRGFFTPWLHPLFTGMTGIGFGIARETTHGWLRYVAPVVGYAFAVFLHAVWNGSTVLLGVFEPGVAGLLLLVAFLLWLLFVLAFVVLMVVLVLRRGRIIRAHLLDEVALGHLSQAEVDMTTSFFGMTDAWVRKGSRGVEFLRAIARLALSKWHSARAVKTGKETISMGFVIPLRKRIQELRREGASPVR